MPHAFTLWIIWIEVGSPSPASILSKSRLRQITLSKGTKLLGKCVTVGVRQTSQLCQVSIGPG